MTLSDYRTRVNDLLFESRAAKENEAQWFAELQECENLETACQEALEVVQGVAEVVQQKAHDKISGVVSKCLCSVFDEPYVFKIVFERKRNKTEARLVFERDGMEVDPLTASGGGVVDVAAFALRVSCLMLSKPAVRRVLIMDEPFKFVSEGYRERVRLMVENLAQDLDLQFIMVTHIPELMMGNVIKL